jgi:hypothetical protein
MMSGARRNLDSTLRVYRFAFPVGDVPDARSLDKASAFVKDALNHAAAQQDVKVLDLQLGTASAR